MQSSLPYIGVLADIRTPGAYSFREIEDGKAGLLDVYRLDHALLTQWDTDAHFETYAVIDPESAPETEGWPRCNKGKIVSEIREQGAELAAVCFAFDFDTPQHRPWETPQEVSSWLDDFAAATDPDPLLNRWSAIYSTRGGARILYTLDRPIPVERAEAAHAEIFRRFSAAGIELCPRCKDWTRVFRLPCVTREEEQTWEAGYFQMHTRWDQRLPVDSLPATEAAPASYEGPSEPMGDQPDPEDCIALLEDHSQRTPRQTQFFKEAKKRLKGRECFDCIFNHTRIASPGSRDDTIHKFVGQATSMLYNIEGATPKHVYALFLSAVQQLEPDSDTPDWTRVLWSASTRTWAKEQDKEQQRLEQIQKEEENAHDMLFRITRGMRKWCNDSRLHGDDQTAMDFVLRHLLVSINSNYLLMQPDGHYDPMMLLPQQVIPRIRACGMDRLIETERPNQNGDMRDISITEIVNRHATVVGAVKALPQIEGGIVEHFDTPQAIATIPAYRRNPHLHPKFDEDVDKWLRKLFQGNYEAACRWIGNALAFEEGPICALSIEGGQGVGKKLLTTGLTECLEFPAEAGPEDLVGNHQYGLIESPFLIVNEGWPAGNNARHPANSFRSVVSGDPMVCARKWMAPVKVANPARVILTANNTNVIRMLTSGQELSPQDREALAIRIFHVDVGDSASEWLRVQGGMGFTGIEGRRWIRGDGNKPSDYVVARHFLWFWKNRTHAPDLRLLMEGNLHQHYEMGLNEDSPHYAAENLMYEMRTQSGRTPLVIEIVIKLLNKPGMKREGFVCTEDGRLFVMSSAILNFYRDNMQLSERLTVNVISDVLKSLSVGSQSRFRSIILPGAEEQGRRSWCEIDIPLLYQATLRHGGDSRNIEALLEAQKTGVPLSQIKGVSTRTTKGRVEARREHLTKDAPLAVDAIKKNSRMKELEQREEE